MASDRSQFNTALRKWDQLHREQRYSSPRGIGGAAILRSTLHFHGNPEAHAAEMAYFKHEAATIAERYVAMGRKAVVLHGTEPEYFAMALQDPEICDMYVIGHGMLPEIYSGEKQSSDWKLVSELTTHLKRGIFEQRFCGRAGRTLSVPLGTFAMDAHSSVIAAVGEVFDPRDNPADEALLRNVTARRALSYDYIKQIFPYEHAPIDQK